LVVVVVVVVVFVFALVFVQNGDDPRTSFRMHKMFMCRKTIELAL
jgi:hypothetical protein